MIQQQSITRSFAIRPIPGDGDLEAAVDAFIRTKGITRCPTACLVPTQATIDAADRAALSRRAAEAEATRSFQPGRGSAPAVQARRHSGGGSRMAVEIGAKGREAHKAAADRFANRMLPIIESIRAAEAVPLPLAAVAEELNRRGVGAPRGGKWRGSAVRRLLDRSGR